VRVSCDFIPRLLIPRHDCDSKYVFFPENIRFVVDTGKIPAFDFSPGNRNMPVGAQVLSDHLPGELGTKIRVWGGFSCEA
jgi:hypothetical protein